MTRLPYRPLIFLAVLGLASLTQAPVLAQGGQCGPRDAVVSHLATKYSETRRSIGLAANNTVMEVYASAETGSWTITVTTAQGMTCLVASGQGYEPVEEGLPAKGSPA
jgi:hypothetical protein